MISRRIPEPEELSVTDDFSRFRYWNGPINPNRSVDAPYGKLYYATGISPRLFGLLRYREAVGTTVPQRRYYFGLIFIGYARQEPQGWWAVLATEDYNLRGEWFLNEDDLHSFIADHMLGA